jgi:ubiquinone/menaquinone biosynthesis C-methylase UbiE
MKEAVDLNNPEVVSVFDELPLWSAPFGLKLLDKVNLRANMRALDIGCGAGFPMIELAQRLGESSKVYGIDPWAEALDRLFVKTKVMSVSNVEVVKGVAEQLPFENGFFDLVVSNNGINNVQDQRAVLAECFRVCRPGGQLVLTMNLPDTMKEFYEVYEQTLRDLGKLSEISRLHDHIFTKRKPLPLTIEMLEKAGFRIEDVAEDSFRLRYLDGTTLFNHFFIRLGFLDGWKSVLADSDVKRTFALLQKNLNTIAAQAGELSLTIPYVCIDCRRNHE